LPAFILWSGHITHTTYYGKNGLLTEVLHFEEGCQYFCQTLSAISWTKVPQNPIGPVCVFFCALMRAWPLTENRAWANIEARVLLTHDDHLAESIVAKFQTVTAVPAAELAALSFIEYLQVLYDL